MPRLFNGTTEFVAANAAHVTNGGVAFTISQWVNGAAQSLKNTYGEGNSAAAGPFFQIQATSGFVIMSARDTASGGSDQISGSHTAFDSTWHHICLTQTTGNLISQFVDGVADGSITRTTLSNAAGQTFNTTSIGTIVRNTNNSLFAGRIAHTALWKRTLSLPEIKSLAAGLSPSLLSPDHYWPLWGTDSPEPNLGNHQLSASVVGTLTGTVAASGCPGNLKMLSV